MPRLFLTLSVIKMRNLCNCRHSHSRRGSMPCGVCCTQLTVWQQLKLAAQHTHRVVCVAHLGNRLSFASPPLSLLSACCCHPPATSWGTLILTRSVHGTRMRFARKLVHVADETKRACLSLSPLSPSLSVHSLTASTPSSTRLPPWPVRQLNTF